jgi:hypothetical protein
MLSCKHSTELMSRELDTHLSWRERLGLRLHLLYCTGCRHFRRQMDFLHRACSAHPAGRDKGSKHPRHP